jgi:cyclopropane fatty-acyl-phospholipid synthase-like methyltransferase
MKSNRVYGKREILDGSKVLEFFETRGKRAKSDSPYSSVLYQDGNPDLALARDLFEKELILPMLDLPNRRRVLDVGCGVGRWGDVLVGKVERYVGVDFSSELVAIAKQRVTAGGFYVMSADEVCRQSLSTEWPFDLVIVSGVFLYLNDDQISRTIRGLLDVIADDGLVYIREPLATEERLTLSSYWSEELKDDYHAIYRTIEQMEKVLTDEMAGSRFSMQGFSPLYNDCSMNNRSETKQFYTFIRA